MVNLDKIVTRFDSELSDRLFRLYANGRQEGTKKKSKLQMVLSAVAGCRNYLGNFYCVEKIMLDNIIIQLSII